MKLKKIFLWFLGIFILSFPIVSTISCLSKKNFRTFDIGYALEDISSLNYIKYESVVPFAHSVVESFRKQSPDLDSPLYSYLNKFPRVMFKLENSSNSRSFNNYSYSSGVLKSSDTIDKYTKFPALESYNSNSDLYTIRLNGKSKWSNDDNLTPSDFIDAFVYVLNLNTGSQLIEQFLNLNINNSHEFVSAQTSYSKKFKELYKNPFGYIKNKNFESSSEHYIYWVQRKDDFPLQIYNKNLSEISNMSLKVKTNYLQKQNEEKILIKNIEKYAKNLGVYADLNSSHPYTHLEGLNEKKMASDEYIFNDDNYFHKNKTLINTKIYPFIFQIKTSIKKSSFQYFINELIRSKWLPINRKFVESIGGIEKFGLSSSNFLVQGPFNIESMILGANGSIILLKNTNYWDNRNTIPNKIRIFFQTDPMILSSLFEDGYISSTMINSISALKLYSDKNYREIIKKSAGYGTTGIVINLDKNSPGFNPIFEDPNLRKAIFYTIDRNEIIKLSSFDTTMPVYSFVDANSDTKSIWRALEPKGINMLQKIGDSIYYDKYEPNKGKKMYPYKMSTHVSNQSLISNLDKKDLFKNERLAKKYFKEFQKTYPGKHTIVYNYDSTKSNLQIGVALQSAIKKTFGDKLKIEIKGYPKSVYETFYTTGKFELTYRNLDYLLGYGSGGISAFFLNDGINKKEQKSVGFIKNPTGGWTFANIIKNTSQFLTKEQLEIKNRLNISNEIWDKIYELSTIPKFLKNKQQEKEIIFLNRRLNAFFAHADFKYDEKKYKKDENFLTNEKITLFVAAANKLILEHSPVLPLFLVDVSISASRIVNYSIGYDKFNFDYGYDYKYKPINNLPGKEALN